MLLSIAHGFVMQRAIVAPLRGWLAENRTMSGSIKRLIGPLLHVSTVAWFLGGVLLIATAWRPDDALRPAVMLAVGLLYAHAAAANAIATRFRHVGWLSPALSVALLAVAYFSER